MKQKKIIFDRKKRTAGEKHGLSAYTASTATSDLQHAPYTSSPSISPLPPQAKAALGGIAAPKSQKKQSVPSDIQKQAKKELLVEEKKNEAQLEQMVEKSQQVLLSIKSVFPFDFFPDEITIDPTKINVVIKNFWGSGSVHSIYITDVTDVKVESTPFFATLKLVDRAFVENKVRVGFLRKKDAYRARRILQGLVVANRNKLNLSGMEINTLAEKVEQLGIETETEL